MAERVGFEPGHESTVPNDPARLSTVELPRPVYDFARKCWNVGTRDDSRDDSPDVVDRKQGEHFIDASGLLDNLLPHPSSPRLTAARGLAKAVVDALREGDVVGARAARALLELTQQLPAASDKPWQGAAGGGGMSAGSDPHAPDTLSTIGLTDRAWIGQTDPVIATATHRPTSSGPNHTASSPAWTCRRPLTCETAIESPIRRPRPI